MNFWIFLPAAVLSLPRQFATVYLGVLAEDKDSELMLSGNTATW